MRALLVRATALVGLIQSGADPQDAWNGLQELAASPSLATRVALAEAIERQPAPAFEGLLLQLADSRDERLAKHVARAMAGVRRPAFLPTLIGWLSCREAREAARAALIEHGEEALRALNEALFDSRTPARVREHIPRTVSLFPPGQAVAVLQGHLAAERDGRVHFKILRALGRIATHRPEVALDVTLVRKVAAGTVAAAIDALRFRVGLVNGAERVPARATPAHRLLVTLLRDKENHRIERFFRLLQLLFREEDVRAIHRGLRDADRRVRAASRELLANLLQDPLRETVTALVDELDDRQRLARLGAVSEIEPADDYASLLTLMVETGSPSLRSLAVFHAREIGIPVRSVNGPRAVVGQPASVAEHAHGR